LDLRCSIVRECFDIRNPVKAPFSYDAVVTTSRITAMQLNRFARHPLTFGPTPIQPLKRLSAHLGGKVELYAKREDCNSGLAFGGNKTRKLEYLIPEALAQGCDTLVSIGGIQSNQTRQVAAVAAHLGMKCVLVQENWVNYSDAVYDRVGNIEMSRILGADVRLDAAGFDIGIRPSWEQAMEDVRRAGGKPFPIPAGCSEHPYGGLGFVGFAEEVREQEAALGFKFDYVVVCSVTGSTQAGMVVGFAADGRAQRVIGIDASAKPEQTREQILRIARNTAALVELGQDIKDEDVVLDTRYGGPEYGLPNEGTLEAIRLCARQEGMLTDPVYEGKSMHGMIEMVRQREFPSGSRVLYAHLGGVPALSAYSYLFRNG
jgi:1-aminocyclopropane-1-carboxylate deaminase